MLLYSVSITDWKKVIGSADCLWQMMNPDYSSVDDHAIGDTKRLPSIKGGFEFPSGLFHNPAIKLSTYNPPNKMLHLSNVSLLVHGNSTKYIIQVQVYKFPNIFSLANVTVQASDLLRFWMSSIPE